MNKIILRSVLTILIVLCIRMIGSRFAIRAIEQLPYTLIDKQDGYEIREYPDHILAQTDVAYDANNQGFGIIAGYIFGGNKSKQSIAMTTPVITQSSEQQSSEKISMTTPVITSQSQDNKTMTMSFVLPRSYTMDTLPIPDDNRVKLVEMPGYKVAVYSFNGYTSDTKVARLTEQLKEALARDGLASSGQVQLMRYNPPFTLPFMRKNEIVISL